MSGFHGVIDEVLVTEGLLEVPIYAYEFDVQDLSDIIQLTAATTG